MCPRRRYIPGDMSPKVALCRHIVPTYVVKERLAVPRPISISANTFWIPSGSVGKSVSMG